MVTRQQKMFNLPIFFKFKSNESKKSKCHKNWFNINFRDIRKNLIKCFYFFNRIYGAFRLHLLFYFFVNFTVLYDTYFTIEWTDFTTYIFVGEKTFEITLLTPRNQSKKCTKTRLQAVILRKEEVFPVQRAIFISVIVTIRCSAGKKIEFKASNFLKIIFLKGKMFKYLENEKSF